MKKIILLFTAALLVMSSNSQIITNIQLSNGSFDTVGIWKFNVKAIIPSGQTWHVGSCNIKIDFYTIPAGKLSVHPDTDYVRGASTPCINNNVNYGKMTTTSINGGTAISLNIVNTSGVYCQFTSGNTYNLGRIRFNRLDSCCTTDTIRHNGPDSSVIRNGGTILNSSQWSVNDPPPCIIVDVSNFASEVPSIYKLYQNYPNPFNPATIIRYDLPKSSYVNLIIYDILGRTISTLENENKSAGNYEIEWNGSYCSSGTYFYKLSAGDFIDVKRMVLLK